MRFDEGHRCRQVFGRFTRIAQYHRSADTDASIVGVVQKLGTQREFSPFGHQVMQALTARFKAGVDADQTGPIGGLEGSGVEAVSLTAARLLYDLTCQPNGGNRR